MRDVISNETVKEINAVIDEILTNIDNNVRNIQIGEGAITLPTLLSYTNYDGQTYNIHGSTFTHHIIIDDANGRTTGHIEDGDIITTVGDKNGRQIGAVDEKISGYSNLEYFRESLYSVATDSYGYEIDRRIPFDIARNYDSGITGFSFNIREQYNEHSISNASCTVMTYKLTNIPVGATFTVTFRGQFHGDFLENEDSYIVINEHFDEIGITIPMPIGDASVEIIKDDQTHNYSITCTNSTQFTDLYLHFYFKVDSFTAFDVDSFLVSGMDLGVIRSSFYHDGESYSFLQGGGGGTSNLDAIELTYAEYQALTPAEKTDPDKIYFITDYPASVGALNDLSDVDITTPTEGQILTYDDTDDEWKNTDVDDIAPTVTEASTRANIATGDTLKTIIGKIKKFFSDLKAVAFSGSYNDLSDKPTIPIVNNGTLTIKQNNTNLGTFTANQSTASNINIECAVPSDVEGSKVVTGNPITLTDGSETYAEELSVDLEPIQDLHGYDKPWVGGAGKNKYPILIGADTWSNNAGATHSNSNGSLVINNVSTSAASGVYGANNTANGLVRNKSYVTYASMDIVSTANCSISICQRPLISVTTTKKKFKVAIPANFDASFSIFCRSVDCTVTISNLMISTEDISVFEPYENISPIQGYDILSVDRCGKNLFNRSDVIANKVPDITDNGRLMTQNGTDTTEHFISLKPSTTYTISGNPRIRFWLYGANGDYLDTYLQDAGQFTTDAQTYFIRISGNSGWQSNSIQIEENISATTYEPYNGTSLTIPLGQTVYGATVDVANGVMVVDKAITTKTWSDGTEATQLTNNIRKMFGTLSDASPNNGEISDKLPMIVNWTQDSSHFYIDPTSKMLVVFMPTNTSTSTEFTICYKLATPITIPLTPTQLKLLKGYNYISSNGTTIHLTYQPDNAVGDAVSKAEKYTDRLCKTGVVDTFNLYNGNTKVGSVSLLSNGFKLLYISSIDDGSVFGMNIPDKYVPKGPYQRAVICFEDSYANPRIIEIYQNHITVTEDKFEHGDTYGTGLYY